MLLTGEPSCVLNIVPSRSMRKRSDEFDQTIPLQEVIDLKKR